MAKMEVILYDHNFARNDAVDDYISLIWTERYADVSDFTITCADTPKNRGRFYTGRFVGLAGSREQMICETPFTENKVLTVKGSSLISIFKSRMLRYDALNATSSRNLKGTPGGIISQIVFDMLCVNSVTYKGEVNPYGLWEIFPQLILGPQASKNTLVRTSAISYGDVFTAVKAMADAANIGFTLYSTLSDGVSAYNLIFTSYDGADRTSTNTSGNPVVRFEPASDSLDDVRELRSIATFKNMCYCWGPSMTDKAATYYGTAWLGADVSTYTGFDRRTMYIVADDITNPDVSSAEKIDDFLAALNQRAKDALANANYVRYVDGTLIPQPQIGYGKDYFLGDLIELRTAVGGSSQARVTEYVQSVDSSGYKAYPTLSVVGEQ